MAKFTNEQLDALAFGERVSSALSLMGAIFILMTFLFTKRFRRPINRLAFYGAFANIFSNIGTIMARDGIIALQKSGKKSHPMCDAQAFLEQAFFLTDTLIALCMAMNVYLTILHNYSAPQLRKLEPFYVTGAYIVPIILSSMMFIRLPGRNPIVGNATSWCWITPEYDYLRIGLFYVPIWLTLCCSSIAYALTGRVIFKLRSSLRKFAATQKANRYESTSKTHLSSFAAESGYSQPPNAIHLTTITHVDSSPREEDTVDNKPGKIGEDVVADQNCTYLVTVESTKTPENDPNDDLKELEAAADATHRLPSARQAANDFKTIGTSTTASPEALKRAALRAKNTLKANAAAYAYAKCAVLFFIGTLITWIPASMNRVYTFVHKDKTLYPLAFAAGVVLPSQGFWNFIVYTATSWKSCKAMWEDIRGALRPTQPSLEKESRNSSFSSGKS